MLPGPVVSTRILAVTAITDRLTTAVAGRYRLERHLGEGGMATVYLAHDLKHDRKVALKVLKPELAAILGAERFLNEIKVTANLQHPNILPLYDSGEADTFLYYVMPFVEGESLRDRMNRERQLGVEETLEITKSVAAALQYAHERKVVHRDIKPENILLQSGQALVADFGIALAVSQAGGTRLTQTGLSLGTPAYMSPEQATGDQGLDARSDIYSLGCMTYEMLVGEPPHVGNSVQAIIAKILSERPSPVSQTRDLVPPNVDAAVMKALAKSPADRFRSAAEFNAALANATFTLPTASGSVVTRTSSRWKERAAVPLVMTAAVLLTAALSGWLRPRPGAAVQVARVPFAMPDSAPLQTQFGTLFTLTADGSRIVYVGPGENDIDLWVRPLNAMTATRVPGTAGADSPFLSPDGEVVAFYRGGPNALHTVTLRGGPRQTLVSDSTVPLGGDWGPDGSIYFARTGGIRRISVEGNTIEEVTRVDTAAGDLAHGWVDVLPDGKGALFTIERAREDQYDIAAVDLGSRKVTILFRGVYARYSESGHIVYATADGGLFAIPFETRSFTVRGSAIPLVAGVVRTERGAAHFAISTNGTLLYGIGHRGGTDQVEWVDRAGRSQVVDTTLKGPFDDLALSPDGKRLAITQRDASGWNVWTKDLNDGPMGRLTLGGRDSYSPAWMPGGEAVVFVSEAGAGQQNLNVRRADGSAAAELLLHTDRAIDYGFVSPDGQWIIYQTVAPPTSRDLYARRVTGDTTLVPLAASPNTPEYSPRLSPDGRWLAYVSNESSQPEVYISPFPNTNTSRTQVSLNGGTEPLWAPNGKELFYQTSAAEFIAARIEAAPPALRVTARTPLFSRAAFKRGATVGTMYGVSPDGQRFIMTRLRGEASEKLVLVLNWFAELTPTAGSK
jgi:serine/threonine protein kinase/Tol biopolymer transport system component